MHSERFSKFSKIGTSFGYITTSARLGLVWSIRFRGFRGGKKTHAIEACRGHYNRIRFIYGIFPLLDKQCFAFCWGVGGGKYMGD